MFAFLKFWGICVLAIPKLSQVQYVCRDRETHLSSRKGTRCHNHMKMGGLYP